MREGFWQSCSGSYFIRNPANSFYHAIGGNHRTVVGRGPKCGIEGHILDWDKAGVIAKEAGLIGPEEEFSLTNTVLEALIYAVEKTELGQHGRSLMDECDYFTKIVREHMNEKGDKKKDSNKKLRLVFDVPTLYKRVFKKDLADGRAWGPPKGLVEERQAEIAAARAAGTTLPVFKPVKNITTFYSGYGPNPAKAIKEANVLAKLWNENLHMEAARLIVRGLKFFWENRDIQKSLGDYYLGNAQVIPTLRALGKMTLEKSDAWAEETRLIPPEKRFSSERFVNIKPPKAVGKGNRSPTEEEEADDDFAPIIIAAGGNDQKKARTRAACEIVFTNMNEKVQKGVDLIHSYEETMVNQAKEIEELKKKLEELEKASKEA